MKLLDIDWQLFLEVLPAFQHLPLEARRLLVQDIQPSQPVAIRVLGRQREALFSSGFLFPGPGGLHAYVADNLRPFVRVIRALNRQRVFDAPSRQAFDRYLSEHFTNQEIGNLCSSYYYNASNHRRLYILASSQEWITSFLEAEGNSLRSSGPENEKATRDLVRALFEEAAPVPFLDLQRLCPGMRAVSLSVAIREAIRGLLLFPALRGEALEPVLGIWPSIAKRISRYVPATPAPVTVDQVCYSPFLMEDMTAILAECAAEPIRLRQGDYKIFAKVEKQLAAAAEKLPDWVEQPFRMDLGARLDMALNFSRVFGFAERTKGRPRDLLMLVTKPGGHWLALPAKDRLKALMEGLIRGRVHTSESCFEEKLSFLPYEVLSYGKADSTVVSAVKSVFAELQPDVFFRIGEFLRYHAERENPLISNGAGRSVGVSLRTSFGERDPEEIGALWAQLLLDFLRTRLLPLGGVKIGVEPGLQPASLQELCFSVSDIGRYLAGAALDFNLVDDSPGRVVVQPNFDVVFLAPLPRAEAEIARFAERKGRQMGTLFRITKKSILAAAAAGLAADQVFDTLRRYCSGEVAPNVAHEISGWVSQCRWIDMRQAVLVHCPDAGTAARVLAVAGTKAIRLNDTTLELQDDESYAGVVRKLREMGIFVER